MRAQGDKARLPSLAATTLLLFAVFSRGATAQRPELQNKVIELQGGHNAIVSDPQSGLLLPHYPEAVAWLQEFWATGKPRQPASSSHHQHSSWFSSHGPAAAPGPNADTASDAHHHWWNKFFPEPAGEQEAIGMSKEKLVCGQPVGRPARRTNLVIVPAGDAWKAERWLDRPEAATFDIIAIYHGKDGNFSCPLCASVGPNKGAKWRLYLDFTSEPDWEDLASRYDYVMLPDDDLDMDACTINKVFDVMREYDLIMAQPSVCAGEGSATWRPELHQNPQYLVRYTTFVEVMSPAYRMDYFHNVVRRTFSKYWTYVGWGLDSVWPALLKYPSNRVGVVDAVCMAHTPTAGGLGTSGKEHSVYAPGLSPYTAKQEELIVFAAFNYSSTTTAALGEAFMSFRVLGGVPNVAVLRAMAETAGDPWPSSKIAAAFGFKEEDLIKEMEFEQVGGGEVGLLDGLPVAGGFEEGVQEQWGSVPSSMTVASVAMLLMGPVRRIPAGYNLLARTGQAFPQGSGIPLGQMFTIDGQIIPEELRNRSASPQMPPPSPENGSPAFAGSSPPPVFYLTGSPSISNNPDFLSILPISNRIFSFLHFEEAPGELALLELTRDPGNGTLSIASSDRVNWAKWRGLWVPCAGSVSPWNTHIGSEEYEPDARALSEATSLADTYDNSSLYVLNSETYGRVVSFMRYFGFERETLTLADVKANFNPYFYGHGFQAAANPDGTYTADKILTLGRISFEMAIIMPDNRTAYISDGGANVGFFKFVAETPGNLSSGGLFAAKFTQIDSTTANGGGSFTIEWIPLGYATQAELWGLLNSNITFADIFSVAKPRSDLSCPSGFNGVNTQANPGKVECLKLKDGQAKAAAFFETRRFAATLGATTEFSKWEGMTYDPKRNVLYTSMSDIRYGMEDLAVLGDTSLRYDGGTSNDIRLQANPCGCVYTVELDSTYSTTHMLGLICGHPRTGVEALADPSDTCDLDNIANPDNLHKYLGVLQ